MILRRRSATYRYRVARVLHVWNTGHDWDGAVVVEQREFRTLQAAEKHRDKIAQEGDTAVLQVGVLAWQSHDASEAMLKQLQTEGWDLE